MKTLDEQLEAALARVKQLEADAQAGSTLLSEAARQSDELRTKVTAFTKESEALTLANTELTEQRDQLSRDLVAAKQSLTSTANTVEELAKAKEQITALTTEVETLKASAKTAERIAAEHYGAANPQPVPVTPRGDAEAEALLTRFKAITDPKEQTVFWRSLTAQQRTLILNAK
jgi:DNA repair exonuclease SbcCD ATPase subunit